MRINIDNEEPARPNEASMNRALNFTLGMERLACFYDARPPEEVAPCLGISEKTLTRWREAGCPAYMREFSSGRTGWHYSIQECLFWVLDEHSTHGRGIPLPALLKGWLDIWTEWQKEQVKAGKLDRVYPVKEYAESLTHYEFAMCLWHGNPDLLPELPRDLLDGCGMVVSFENLETREYIEHVLYCMRNA